jgi:AraC-like DNA-binding protein
VQTRSIHADTDNVHGPATGPLHDHEHHELLWAISGTFRVELGERSWSLVPGGGVWVPAGTAHRTVGSDSHQYGWALIRVDACPDLWTRTTPVRIEPLLQHLLQHLASPVADSSRAEAEAVVIDRLASCLSTSMVELPLPADPRCREIVEALLRDPAHRWELAEWAGEVGASSRTLSRLFLTETGMSFGQWRALTRVRAAIALLGEGIPVGVVARRVGYATPSAFITAFRRGTGRTPGSFADDGVPRRLVS